uniref:Transposase Tc1-like domain-containing protein n=1 Tax=Gadus morhua TaxID=8049 RepID=A0A8C4ZXH5_GADMO
MKNLPNLFWELQGGVSQNQVAALFGVSPSTLSKLKAKFHIMGDVKDRPRSGRPKKTTPQEDHFITLSALRCRRLPSTDLQSRFAGRYVRRIFAQTIRNRLHAANLRSHRAARSPAMTALHRQARLRWCQQHILPPECGCGEDGMAC